MKKVLIIAALLVGMTATAQREGHPQHRKALKDMTAEQLATLQTKRMALALDLNETQQKQIQEVNLKNAKIRKEKMTERENNKEQDDTEKPSTNQRFANQNERLDHMLAYQAEVKEILNEEQYQQWKKFNHRKHLRGKKKMQRRDVEG